MNSRKLIVLIKLFEIVNSKFHKTTQLRLQKRKLYENYCTKRSDGN